VGGHCEEPPGIEGAVDTVTESDQRIAKEGGPIKPELDIRCSMVNMSGKDIA
jgi:hypothetical protein